MISNFVYFHIDQALDLVFGGLPTVNICRTNKSKPPPIPFKQRVRRLRVDPRRPSSSRSLPRPLPAKRHNLSQIALDQSSSVRGEKPQTCMLLGRLPKHIRARIFQLVLGENQFFLVHVWKGLGHVQSRGIEKELTYSTGKCVSLPLRMGRRDYCWLQSSTWDKKGQFKIDCETYHKTDCANSALLKTCRQVYTEAVDFLYSENIFELDNIFVLEYLKTTILPQRFRAIKFLKLSWIVKTDDEVYLPTLEHKEDFWTGAWARFWKLAATEMQLESLFVDLHFPNDATAAAMFSIVTTPMRQVHGLKRCEVWDTYLDCYQRDGMLELMTTMCLPEKKN